ncbi:hypothetical protein [Blastococcus saxobsidens]|uniref:Uncharacterized protein n=1 Tax=Blastococcus saxobsidens (strain DD2) TaxID=1146883 RepID=H6RLW3_BLASD|nr:hypothetical protein [Blastococcus saxobsidens]CCG05042.1 conserved membrane protein of unknown function [Blastococcus saxobsidens DD2]
MTASQPPQPPEGAQPPAGQQPPLGQGEQPLAPERSAAGQLPGQPSPGRPPYGQPPYGQPPYGPPPYGPPPYGPPPYGPPPYGPPPYGPPPYGQPPYGPPPYGQPAYGQPPYGQQPFPQPGYGHPGYGQPPYGPPQYGQPPYGQPPYGQAPYGQAPFGPPGYPGGRPAGGGAEFSVDLKRLTRDDYVVAGGTVLFLLFGLLPWWRFGDATFGVTFSGFDDGMVVSAFVLFLLAAGWALLPGFVRTSLTFPRSSVTVTLAGLGLVLTLFAWLDTLRYAFSFWALLAFLTAVAITVVPALALRRELRDRPARPAPPQPGAYWPAPGQPHPPGPGPLPPQAHPGQPGPAGGQHGYPPPWQAPPPPPERERDRPGDPAGPGGSTASGEGHDATESERPRTDP